MMIFDQFPSRDEAEQFAAHVKRRDKRSARVFDSQDDSNRVDPFPYRLEAPIVLVERNEDLSGEKKFHRVVLRFGGRFSGT